MDFRVIAAAELRVVFLLAVIRQGLTGDLPAGDPAAIRECCDEQTVNLSESLHVVQNRINAFIHERDGANLDADHLIARIVQRGSDCMAVTEGVRAAAETAENARLLMFRHVALP